MKKMVCALGLLCATGLVGCGNVEPKNPEQAGDTNGSTPSSGGSHSEKPSAPVIIDGQVTDSTASIKVGFSSEATDVKIDVWGVDGLTVTNSTMTANGQPASQTRFARGEYVQVEVSFTAPKDFRSNLAIKVRGTFGGKVQEKVQSFTVNSSAPPKTTGPGDVRVGPDGSPVRVMKAP